MAGYHRMKLFSLFFMLMFAVCVFAQPSMQLVDANEPILQDSLETDLLSKISLVLDVDTNGVVDTNKVEHIDAGIEKNPIAEREFFPSGFVMEIAYAAPTVIQVPFLGMRDKSAVWGNEFVATGYAVVSVDVEFRSGGVRVSDEFLWAFILSVSVSGNPNDPTINREKRDRISEWVEYILIGNTYWALSEKSRIGLFESHHFVDYGISNLVYSEGWELGWSQAAGVRIVYSGSYKEGGYYIDLGGHVRITNRHFRFGAFVQLGLFGSSK